MVRCWDIRMHWHDQAKKVCVCLSMALYVDRDKKSKYFCLEGYKSLVLCSPLKVRQNIGKFLCYFGKWTFEVITDWHKNWK